MTAPNARAEAVSRAVSLLNASGAKFAVVFGDTKYGDLDVVIQPIRTKTNWNAKYGHVKRVNEMKVGDELVFEVEPDDMKMFGNALRTLLGDRFGSNSYVMSSNQTVISVLLIEVTKKTETPELATN